MRSLHQIVRSVLLTEGFADDNLARKIALSLYMSKLIPEKYEKNDAIHDLIEFANNSANNRPRQALRLSSDQLANVEHFYDMILEKYGNPAANGEISRKLSLKKIQIALTQAAETGKAIWPINAMEMGRRSYDKEIVPNHVYNSLLSMTSDSGNLNLDDTALGELEEAYPNTVSAMRDISSACKDLSNSKDEDFHRVSESVITYATDIVELLNNNEAYDDESLFESLADLDLDSESNSPVDPALQNLSQNSEAVDADAEKSVDADTEEDENALNAIQAISDAVVVIREEIDKFSMLIDSDKIEVKLNAIQDEIRPWLEF